MEIQIPLVLFTSFLAWSIGAFVTQCILSLKGEGKQLQIIVLITSVVLLAIGGISVTFHLTHVFNLFNGFGHITSGITQELIGIVILVIVMVLYFLMARRSEDASVPKWLAIVGIVVSIILLIAMGHSYMMVSRPAWDSVLQLLSLFGGACVLGPATVAVIAAIKGVEIPSIGKLNVVGSIVNAVLTVAYLVAMQVSSSTLQSFAYYFDPTHPNYAVKSASDASLFSGDCVAFTILTILGLIVAVVAAYMGKKSGDWKKWGIVVIVAGLVCVVALRIAMYVMGASYFMVY
jgi:DMSO reductase anchor subunit